MEIKLTAPEIAALMMMLAAELENTQGTDWREKLLIKLTEAYAKI